MSFLGCFTHGVKLSSWPGLPPEANSYPGTCCLLWGSFASVLAEGIEMSRVKAWEIMGSFGSQGMNGLTQGVLQKGMVLGPCHRLHLHNEEGHFLLVFLLLLDSVVTFYSGWWIISLLFWLNNCMGVRELKQELPDHSLKAIFCLRRAFLSVNGVKKEAKIPTTSSFTKPTLLSSFFCCFPSYSLSSPDGL